MARPWEKYQRGGNGIFQLPPDEQEQAQINSARVNTAGKATENRIADATAGDAIAKARADRLRAEAEARQAAELESFRRAHGGMTPEQWTTAQNANREQAQRRAPLDALNSQLRRTWDLYQQGPGSTKPWSASALADFNPWSESNSKFDVAGAGLGEMGRSAFRIPGQGDQAVKEMEAFIKANQPSASDTDAAIREKLSNIERRMGAQYKAMGVPYKPYRPKGAPKSAPRKSSGWSIQRIDD